MPLLPPRPLSVLSASAVPSSSEYREPARILETVDCGSGHHYGICPKCQRGHGHRIDLRPPASLPQ